jgi:hypothetical protein
MILRNRVWVRRVHVQHDVALQLDVLEGHLLRPDRDRPVLPAGEDVTAPRYLFDVRVLGYHPVALVTEATRSAGHVDPVDRLGAAQFGELRDGQAGDVYVWIQEVEGGRNAGGIPVRGSHSGLLNCNVF